ncbi:MAG: ABC transporter permease subunit [Actinobacteria bacterium]|jgi:ABC-type spermidine/putrescine transport system permease subunit I|nr:ABC transporter permease subunit [Actinomycetota bacterium]
MALPPILVLGTFIGFPIGLAFLFSIGFTGGLNEVLSIIGQDVRGRDGKLFTLQAYKDVIADPRFAGDVKTTLIVSFVATVFVLLFSTGIGLLQRLRGGKLSSVLTALSLTPLFIPVVISSWALYTFYGSAGLYRTIFHSFGIDVPQITSTMLAVIIGSIWVSLPFATLMITSGLQSVPNALIEAAQDAGASLITIIRTVMLPLALIPIIIALTFTSIGILGSFTVPFFLGANQPTMFGVEITNFFSVYNRPQQSIVMAFIVFAAASGIAFFYIWANFRNAKESGRV